MQDARLIALTLVLAAAAPIMAQPTPEVVGLLPYAPPTAIDLSGSAAFIGTEAGLAVVDMSDPTAVLMVAGLPTPAPVLGVDVSGTSAILAVGESGVEMIDLSLPTRPVRVASISTEGVAHAAVPVGDLLVVADGPAGLCIAPTASDPVAPACATFQSDAVDVAIMGSYAVVVDADGWLRVIDISDPQTPTEIGSVSASARDVEIAGSHALVAAGSEGLRVVDLSNPEAPNVVASLATTHEARGVELQGSLAYVVLPYAMLTVDVSDPLSPSTLSTFEVPTGGSALAVDGSTVVTLDSYSLAAHAIDVSDPSSPVDVAHFERWGPWDVETLGSLATVFVGTSYSGCVASLSLVDISTPEHPAEVGFLHLGVCADAAVTTRTHAFVAQRGVLRVIDISSPAHPVDVASLAIPNGVRDLAVDGDLLLMSDSSTRMLLFDISDPSFPVGISALPLDVNVGQVAISGGRAFVGYSVSQWGVANGGFLVVDIADPSNPIILGSAGSGAPIEILVDRSFVTVLGFVATAASHYNILRRFDVRGNADPVLVVEYYDRPATYLNGIAIMPPLVFSTWRVVSAVFAYKDGVLPRDWQQYLILPEPIAAAVAGSHLLVIDLDQGLYVLDPSPMTSVFQDGFDSGGLGSWSASAP
jgi:hypothetical protein